MKTIFIDTETTSSNSQTCGLVQIAGIVEIEGKEIDRFNINSNIFGDEEISEEALEINGLTMKQIQKFPKPRIAFAKFISQLKKHIDQYNKTDKFIALAYKSEFDNNVLRNWFIRNNDQYFGSWFWNPWIDIMNLAMYILQSERHQLTNFKLITVAEYLGIDLDKRNAHDALYDVELARKVYKEIT